MRLLVVEDDESIAEPLCTGLRREGFDVQRVSTGADALDADPVDLILLDLGLPDLDGRVVCRRIRETSETPIIVITARSDEMERVGLLESGADDYLVKPFGFRELVARIGAVSRRASRGPQPLDEVLTVGPVEVDRKSRKVRVDGEPVSLPPREFDLLAYLMSDPSAVKPRDRIMRDVWDEHWWGSTKTLDVHIASLRRKIGAEMIETVRGVGFRMRDPDEST